MNRTGAPFTPQRCMGYHKPQPMRTLLLLLALTTTTQAQWEIQPSPTTADLRGIHAVSPEIAWASGTDGTVLRTVDAGAHWTLCATPPDAEHLDFRGIQAFDDKEAVVMSSGKGPLSRLYKTTDGCAHWTLLFTNPDTAGFWDAVRFLDPNFAILIGDPIGPEIYAVWTHDGGRTWRKFEQTEAPPLRPGASLFAASNSAIAVPNADSVFAVVNDGKQSLSLEADFEELCRILDGQTTQPSSCVKEYTWMNAVTLPNPLANDTSGIFSVAARSGSDDHLLIAVGGDYKTPEQTGMAAFSDGNEWHPAQTPPQGYRSSVAYEAHTRTWITVGPNGTDVSTDDGRNWHPLHPPAASDGNQDQRDADKNWNALSLPYVVGPHGRIGKLRPNSLPAPSQVPGHPPHLSDTQES